MISYDRDLCHERVSLISIKKGLEVFITLLTKNLNYISLYFFLFKAYNDFLKVLETRFSQLKRYVTTYKTLKHLNNRETINHRGVFWTYQTVIVERFLKAANYQRKILHLRCLTGFSIRLWTKPDYICYAIFTIEVTFMT